VAVAALAFLAWCMLSTISRPGLQYDESLFVNASLGGHYAGGSFVADRFHGIPTMVMPYIGALKSWLYAPVFKTFGVSVDSIRIPVVLILFASIGIAFAFARRLLGAWPAVLLVLLLATDPVYTTMAKADWGPVALSGLLRVAALAAYFTWLRTRSVRYLWLLIAAVVLGLFNKVDYLAFAASLAVAAVVVHHRAIAACLRRRARASVLAGAALAVALVVEYVEIYEPARSFPTTRSHAGLLGRVSEVWALFRHTMDGTGLYAYTTGTPLAHRTAIVPVTAVVVALATALALWWLARVWRRPVAPELAPLAEATTTTSFFLILLLTMALVLVKTPQAVGPHHIALIWPLPALLAASLVHAAARLPRPRMRVPAIAVVALAIAWLAGTQLRTATEFRSAFASNRASSPIWTTEIYPLARAVRGVAPGVAGVVTADWGIGNQLLALGDDAVRRRLDDTWATFAGGSTVAIDQLAGAAFRGRRVIVALHAPGAEIMPGTYARSTAMLRRLKPARATRTIYRGLALLALLVDDRPVSAR
jgi:hypothetical protein